MTAKLTGETATIYQFPARRPVITSPPRASASQPASASKPVTTGGSGWYHEAAVVEEAAQPDKPAGRH